MLEARKHAKINVKVDIAELLLLLPLMPFVHSHTHHASDTMLSAGKYDDVVDVDGTENKTFQTT